jgi:D-aminoacyl-tRNA deacylase
MILLLASKRDIAGMNIAQQIIQLHSFKEMPQEFDRYPVYEQKIANEKVLLAFTDKELIKSQGVTKHFQPKLIVFLSRHASQAGTPTLSVHTPGNLTSQAKMGGLPKKISISPASKMKKTLTTMAKLVQERGLEYDVSYECTHHGPSLDTPAMFAELGSTIMQWKDIDAAEIVAKAVIEAIKNFSLYPTAIGIGGPHYNRKFTKIALTSGTAFAHIIPKYVIPEIEEKMIQKCVERVVEKVETAILDWKGIKGEHKPKIVKALEKLNIKIEKV